MFLRNKKHYLLFLLILALSECDTSYKQDLFETISFDDWLNASDTTGTFSINNYKVENEPTKRFSIDDFSTALNILNSKNALKSNNVLKKQDQYANFPIQEAQLNCIHEIDSNAFSNLVDSLFSNFILSEPNKRLVKINLVNAYENNYFFQNSSPTSNRTFHIIEGGKDFYLHFNFNVGYTNRIDKFCEGLTKSGNNNLWATITTQIYIGNLALMGQLESFIISNEPLSQLNKNKINHKKHEDKNVYYVKRNSKVISKKANINGQFRNYKVLVRSFGDL